jgi:hypothetical protein
MVSESEVGIKGRTHSFGEKVGRVSEAVPIIAEEDGKAVVGVGHVAEDNGGLARRDHLDERRLVDLVVLVGAMIDPPQPRDVASPVFGDEIHDAVPDVEVVEQGEARHMPENRGLGHLFEQVRVRRVGRGRRSQRSPVNTRLACDGLWRVAEGEDGGQEEGEGEAAGSCDADPRRRQ